MRRRLGVLTVLTAVLATSAGASAATGGGGGEGKAAAQKPLQFEEHNLYIETNDTDKDAGLQVFVDAEQWRHFKLLDKNGDTMVDLNTRERCATSA